MGLVCAHLAFPGSEVANFAVSLRPVVQISANVREWFFVIFFLFYFWIIKLMVIVVCMYGHTIPQISLAPHAPKSWKKFTTSRGEIYQSNFLVRFASYVTHGHLTTSCQSNCHVPLFWCKENEPDSEYLATLERISGEFLATLAVQAVFGNLSGGGGGGVAISASLCCSLILSDSTTLRILTTTKRVRTH